MDLAYLASRDVASRGLSTHMLYKPTLLVFRGSCSTPGAAARYSGEYPYYPPNINVKPDQTVNDLVANDIQAHVRSVSYHMRFDYYYLIPSNLPSSVS